MLEYLKATNYTYHHQLSITFKREYLVWFLHFGPSSRISTRALWIIVCCKDKLLRKFKNHHRELLKIKKKTQTINIQKSNNQRNTLTLMNQHRQEQQVTILTCSVPQTEWLLGNKVNAVVLCWFNGNKSLKDNDCLKTIYWCHRTLTWHNLPHIIWYL